MSAADHARSMRGRHRCDSPHCAYCNVFNRPTPAADRHPTEAGAGDVRVFRDGDQWCALAGPDLAVGFAGFGPTPVHALRDLANAVNGDEWPDVIPWAERAPAPAPVGEPTPEQTASGADVYASVRAMATITPSAPADAGGEVDRWDMTYEDGICCMEKVPDGEFVRLDDYRALAARAREGCSEATCAGWSTAKALREDLAHAVARAERAEFEVTAYGERIAAEARTGEGYRERAEAAEESEREMAHALAVARREAAALRERCERLEAALGQVRSAFDDYAYEMTRTHQSGERQHAAFTDLVRAMARTSALDTARASAGGEPPQAGADVVADAFNRELLAAHDQFTRELDAACARAVAEGEVKHGE